MSAFDKLDPAARRAAFAHMSAASKVTKAKKSPAADRLNRRYTHVESRPDGTIRKVGTISPAEAAVVMFGTKGAQQKIARYNARHGGKAAAKMAAAGQGLKAAQDARIRAATRSRVQQDIAETRRQQAMWARRPSQ